MFSHSLSEDQHVLNPSTDTLLRVARVSQAIFKAVWGPNWGDEVFQNSVYTWFTSSVKLGANQSSRFTCLEGHTIFAVPSLYGAGSARSDFSSCLPVP